MNPRSHETPAMTMTRREVLRAAAVAPLAASLGGGQAILPVRTDTIVCPPPLVPVRDYILDKVTKHIVPSVTVAITRADQWIWLESFGFADLESSRPATPSTIYKLASLSKPLTATALMTLVDRGLVDLDAPANDYLKRGKLTARVGSAKQMTVRRLLDHTAGLPTHENLFFDGVPPLAREETLRRHGFAAWEPGTQMHYSNLSTAIAGFISEDVSGMRFEEFLDRALAGIRRNRDAQHAVPYDYDIASRFVRTGEHLTDHSGGSSLRASALDMTRFLRMHLHGGVLDGRRILSEPLAREMQRQSSDSGKGWGYGFGFQTDVVRGQRSFFHAGGGPGMATWMRAFPDEALTVVVLTNYFGGMAEEVSKRISAALFADGPSSPAPAAAPALAPEKYIGEWRGTLEHHRGNIPLRLFVSAQTIEAQFGTTPWRQTLRETSMNAEELTGSTDGILDVHAGFHGPPVFEFHLRRDGERLIGVCHVYAKGYFELAHWCELDRV